MKKTFALLLIILVILLSGCATDANVASRNLSVAADQFEITRRVVFYNGITGEYMLQIEGRCSITADMADAMQNLIDIQQQQLSIQFKYITDSEIIDSIDNLDAWEDEIDPTRINVSVIVRTRAGRLVEVNRTIRF